MKILVERDDIVDAIEELTPYGKYAAINAAISILDRILEANPEGQREIVLEEFLEKYSDEATNRSVILKLLDALIEVETTIDSRSPLDAESRLARRCRVLKTTLESKP